MTANVKYALIFMRLENNMKIQSKLVLQLELWTIKFSAFLSRTNEKGSSPIIFFILDRKKKD